MPVVGPRRPSRTAAFAAAVQRRGRLLRGRRIACAAPRVATVFRSPLRPPVLRRGNPGAADLAVRLSIEWRIDAAATRAARGASSSGIPQPARTDAPATAMTLRMTRPTSAPTPVRQQAGARRPAAAMVLRTSPSNRRSSGSPGPGARVTADAHALAAPSRPQRSVAMVHRDQAPAVQQPAPAPSVLRPGTTATATGWPAHLPASTPPLTAADLPTVIDRVVHELDRRVVAARERKGWTA